MKTLKNISLSLFAALFMLPTMLVAQMHQRDTSPFSGIKAGEIFTVIISQGETHDLKLEVPEEHLDNIKTRVRNGVLHLEYSGRARDLNKITAHVTAPQIVSMEAGGASVFRSETLLVSPSLDVNGSGASNINLELKTDRLHSKISGATNVTYNGEATVHQLEGSGASAVRAYGLSTETADIKLSGASSAEIKVSTRLKAHGSGTSRFSYRGEPLSKELSTSGMATIKGIDEDPGRIAKDENDTLRVRIGEREVQVTEGRPITITTKRRTTRQFMNNWSGFELGINGYLTPDNSINLDAEDEYMDLEYNRSIAVNLNLFQQNLPLVSNRLAMYTGLGVSWNNYRFSNNIRLVHGEDQLEHYTDTIHSFRKNKLALLHLNVPLMLEFQTPDRRGFHIAAGFNLGVRLRSNTKYVYSFDGSRQREKDYKDFYLAPFRYDATARIGFGRINLFATYALNPLFRQDKGPEIHPFSIGIRVLNF